jgi:hypothetical protein
LEEKINWVTNSHLGIGYINLSMSDYLFCLLHLDFPNHDASCHTPGIVGKPWMSRGAMRWFHDVRMVEQL